MGRATKKQREKMRKHFTKPKKRKIEWDRFCVAYMKMVNNNGMFKACKVEERPEESCEGCIYNRRMKRVIKDAK